MSLVGRLLIALAVGARLIAAPSVGAQTLGSPTVPRDTTVRDTLEAVVVRATRAGTAVPTSQTRLDRATIERSYVGQDAPLALLGATGITAASDAGGFSGYSSIRLRGVDQTRLAISMDGIPLNDPEDQVLYFSNVPDFMNSMRSVQVQRGVGSSGFGTASFAGSLNFESVPLMTTPRSVEAQLTAGSWGTRRVSLEGATGLVDGFAAYARVSQQETDGYRIRSGNDARSGFVSAGWFGARDALKFTGFAGRSKMQLAYYAPSEAALEANPRTNPMAPEERDDFRQEMASLQYTRVLRPGFTVTTTGYRNSAGGAYDVFVGADLWNFNLDHVWYGLLSTLAWEGDGVSIAAGAHVSTYARDHILYIRPDLTNRVYDNTGHKNEQSAFLKATWSGSRLDWHADLQVRRAAFRYDPSSVNTYAAPSIHWLFVNPKLGVTLRAWPGAEFFVSVAQSGREPTRSDMFAGADDLDDAAAAELLPLDQVKPERLIDIEVGARFRRGSAEFTANLFAMQFRDEIAPIGAMSVTGSQLRRNVSRSARQGIELETRWSARPSVLVTANTMVMRARIAEYTDEASATTYRDVAPLLTPALIANGQVAWVPRPGAELSLSLRHVGESHLANDGNDALVTPAFTLTDLGASFAAGPTTLRLQVQNLLDVVAYASGYTDGTTRYFFPISSRTLMATLVLTF